MHYSHLCIQEVDDTAYNTAQRAILVDSCAIESEVVWPYQQRLHIVVNLVAAWQRDQRGVIYL